MEWNRMEYAMEIKCNGMEYGIKWNGTERNMEWNMEYGIEGNGME